MHTQIKLIWKIISNIKYRKLLKESITQIVPKSLTKENIYLKPQRNKRGKRKADIWSSNNPGKTFQMCVKAYFSQFGLLKWVKILKEREQEVVCHKGNPNSQRKQEHMCQSRSNLRWGHFSQSLYISCKNIISTHN